MKLIPTIFCSLLLGSAIGGGWSYVTIGTAIDPPTISPSPKQLSPAKLAASPQVVVQETQYDFGTMLRGAKMSHEFTVRNEGLAPLTLTEGGSTCKCTVGYVSGEAIPPGGTGTVLLEWVAKVNPGPFRQTANIITNDPQQELIQLSVSGKVTNTASLLPSELYLGTLHAASEAQTSLFVLSHESTDLQVTAEVDGSSDFPDRFEFQITPVSPAEAVKDTDVAMPKAAARVEVKAKSGLPIGNLNDWVRIETNLTGQEELLVPIYGRVEGDLTVHGGGWNKQAGALNMGTIDGKQGAEVKVLVSCKGPYAETIEFEVASVDPSELQVELGERRMRRKDVSHTPLLLTIPPGTRPMIRMANAQGEEGQVVLRSNHPESPELRLGVRLLVKD